jgi:hypothetical protein
MELQKIISQEVAKISEAQALTVSEGPKTGEENAFALAAYSEKVIKCSDEQIKQVLRFIMIKVGLRAPNWPVDEEKAVLLDHIRTHYGLHGLEEIRLAFDMAVTGKLDLTDNQVICYENFTCTYFSVIMSAYRKWAGETYDHVIKDQPTPEMYNIDTRGLIEEAYQKFLLDEQVNYRFFPISFHEQLVEDGSIHPQYYISLKAEVKKEICTELQKDLSAMIIEASEANEGKIAILNKQLNEFRAGNRESAIVCRAKQLAVWILFREARRMKMPALYERVDAPRMLQEEY